MNCSVSGCENKIEARGWCNKHYTRWRRYGNPGIIKNERHGYRNHSLYIVWIDMKQRCYNPSFKYYKHYGGRGITVCDEWMSPKVFIKWCLVNGWEQELEIDRKNNDGNYKPGNCRFITHKENIHNTRLLRSTNTSGYRGVSYYRTGKKWHAYITINSKQKHLGYFNSPEEAAIAYNNAIIDNRPKNFS